MLLTNTLKKSLFITLNFILIFFILEQHNFASEGWQLNENTEEISETEEIELGRKIDEYVTNQFYIENNQELNKAVNEIIQRIITTSDIKSFNINCKIIQSNSINAFSAPGGYVYLTYGLLRFAETEDEVAGIVGHELAHVSLRHASKFYHEVMKTLPKDDNKNNSTAVLLLLNNHLEEYEHEADTTGVIYAQKAGYNPSGLLEFLERHSSLLVYNKVLGFFRFDTYVTINSRIDYLRNYITNMLEKQNHP
ncbi:MAG TPA: M48 family metalloprotease [Candidatus Wujingus californicus]|uniref:M48 family metalloprotease n=1 Tax=Candidatus Wujingus californicus TaxID=3367618 RepID=UPI001DCC9609|nr:M48 family metalloprotease [Planctomycetota bacterium]MDO8132131.1 M48 family metalloprotease [Candidatus Brocadiales bacterium]